MLQKRSSVLLIVLALIAISALPASAHQLKSASATANCQGYTLTATAVGLGIGKTYTIDYTFTISCSGSQPVNVPGSITFTATARTMTVTTSGKLPGLIGSCVITGTAYLDADKDKVRVITINGVKAAPLTCSPVSANCAMIVAEQGVPITPVTLTASGGAGPPYTFTATGLPAGLSISQSGTISGTPTVSGTFNYTVTVTDSAGNTGTTNCSVNVTPPVALSCSGTSVGDVGVPFNSPPPTVTGGVAPYTFSIGSGALPPGLTLNTSTGAVTGTATAPGSFTIKVTDSLGATATGCMITINPAVQLTCSGTSVGDVGVPFNSGPQTVTGGTPPYTFSIASGTLPAGLNLNTSTGAVSGTATAAGSFTLKVTDSLGSAATGCTITINPPVQLTCTGTTSGTVGVPFNSGAPTVSGGTPPYTFAIVGTIAPGLTLNTSTGAVTGTPTATGSFSIQVTDSLGAVGTPTCPITIDASPCLTSQLGPAAGFSVLGLQGANVQLSGQLQIAGNVGIGANGQLSVSKGDSFPGTLYADPTANLQIPNGAFAGGVVTQSMAAIQSAALAEASAVGSLSPTQTFSQIQSATTITGDGGQNVIQVNGSVNLNNANLTLSGGANDTFIFNIVGGFNLNNANIVLNGVAANQVLFYFPGSGNQIQTNASNTAGVFLAPNRNISVMGGTHTTEFISGGSIDLSSCGGNTVIKSIPACSGEQVTLACPANSGVVGTAYSSALVATGGVEPYTFSITSGSLPAGLALNSSNGDIAGTPTEANPYSFTAQVVDSSGSPSGTASASCTITITSSGYVCTIGPSGTQVSMQWSRFRTQGSGNVVWVNAHIGTPQGIPTNQVTTIQFTSVSLVLNGQTYALPDGFLVFNPSAPQIPTTSFNSSYGSNGAWTTTLNPNYLSNQIFFDGAALPVDGNLQSGGNATLSFTTESTDNDLAFDWQWGAAAYSYWPGDNQANILPYQTNLNAGTPQNSQVQQSLIQYGPDQGGGCNGYTGSFSSTGYGSCPGAQ